MTKDMTEGAITPLLISVTIPLVLGESFSNVLQCGGQCDCGAFCRQGCTGGSRKTSGPLMALVILFISGMCMGAGVLMGMYYGAHDYGKFERQISSAMLGRLAFSMLLALVCAVSAPQLLRLIRTQREVLPIASEYLRIVFLGLVFTFVYNFFASTLRALGDSKTPLYFLMVSAVLNILGDLLFVVVFGWGSQTIVNTMGVASMAVFT